MFYSMMSEEIKVLNDIWRVFLQSKQLRSWNSQLSYFLTNTKQTHIVNHSKEISNYQLGNALFMQPEHVKVQKSKFGEKKFKHIKVDGKLNSEKIIQSDMILSMWYWNLLIEK